MAEANPPPSGPDSSEVVRYDVTFLDGLLADTVSGESLPETGTSAIIDSQVLDLVVSDMCELPEKKYAYLANPPVARRGPINSFCNLIGGKFNREPEHMVDTRTGALALQY